MPRILKNCAVCGELFCPSEWLCKCCSAICGCRYKLAPYLKTKLYNKREELDGLSDKNKDLIISMLNDGKTESEAADCLGLSITTVYLVKWSKEK